ncbi:hypothetical protein EON67_12225 [archaeon]|nr:MAG: hypothetical protein EON67_12225 [archaeon]
MRARAPCLLCVRTRVRVGLCEHGVQASDMNSVMAAYRVWAQTLFPRMHSSDVLAKIGDWSGRQVLKVRMAGPVVSYTTAPLLPAVLFRAHANWLLLFFATRVVCCRAHCNRCECTLRYHAQREKCPC